MRHRRHHRHAHAHAHGHRPSDEQQAVGAKPLALGKGRRRARLALRYNYNRTISRLPAQIGRYAHTKQFKRMKKALRTLRTHVGRVQREVTRQLRPLPEQVQTKVGDLLARTGRILAKRTRDGNKFYAPHAHRVECISQGKARTTYEFGVKVNIATTRTENLVVGIRSMPGNPYSGHILSETLEQVDIRTGTDRKPKTAVVGPGYRGVQIEGVRILTSGRKRGITLTLKAVHCMR